MYNRTTGSWREEIIKTGTPIWELVYPIRVRASALIDEQLAKEYGRVITGDPRSDAEALTEMVLCYKTINDMVEFYRINTTFYLADNKSAGFIYDIVNNYLQAWVGQIQQGVNYGKVPVDDLLLLDDFASKIKRQSLAFCGYAKPSSVGKIGLLAAAFGIHRESREGDAYEPETGHVSCAEVFSRTMFRPTAAAPQVGVAAVPAGVSRWK